MYCEEFEKKIHEIILKECIDKSEFSQILRGFSTSLEMNRATFIKISGNMI